MRGFLQNDHREGWCFAPTLRCGLLDGWTGARPDRLGRGRGAVPAGGRGAAADTPRTMGDDSSAGAAAHRMNKWDLTARIISVS